MATYQPYLIANFATATDQSREPWLIPDEAQQEILDGFVYRGILEKREGYGYYATGEKGGAPYCESRIVHRITAEAYGTGNGTVGPYTHVAANLPLRRGTIVITAGVQTARDNGLGVFVTTPAGGTGTVNYTTGSMSVTFNGVVAGATPITVTYDYHPGNPVMMIASYYTATNTRQMIVCDTQYVNRYNPATNRLDDISSISDASHTSPYTGSSSNFFTWTNYPDASSDPRLLFSNNVNTIQSYDGINIQNYIFTSGGAITTLSCLLMFQYKDRLVLLNTLEDGTRFSLRIRVSGYGANCDEFAVTAPGAGVIDIPDFGAITGAAFNRDDLIIQTNQSYWILKFTGNDSVPFVLDRLDSTRGSDAPFGTITYLNLTTSASKLGLTGSDGYKVDRIDKKLPDYSYNKIDQDNFDLCFSGSVDEDRDHYLIHPSPEQTASDRILVNNYEEHNFSVYRLPLSCMGNYITSFDITWNDLLVFENWDQMAEEYGSWYDFAYTKGAPISIGGGHHGEIWQLALQETVDSPIKVRNLTVSAGIATVTTDFNTFAVGDYIYFESLGGSVELNDKQFPIKSITSNYIFTIDVSIIESISGYTSGGVVAKPIPFEALSKKFNPFSNAAAKVRCGWMYFYVSSSGTSLTDQKGDPVPAKIDVSVIVNDVEEPTQVEDGSLATIPFPYQVNCTPSSEDEGVKRWYKIFINQTGRFIQFKIKNNQAGAKIKIHAIMPGFMPVGRLI